MMDTLAIIHKVLTELSSDWQSFYGTFVQAGVMVLLCGVFVPSRGMSIWSSPIDLVMLYAILPSIVAALFAADSFAGERERNTLETLLATPISDRAIYLGKVLAALGISVTCSLLALAVAVGTTLLVQGADPLAAVGLFGFSTVITGAAVFGLTTTALAVAVSRKTKVARSAQQVASMLSLLLSVVFLWLTSLLQLSSAWLQVLVAEAAPLVVGAALLALELRTFQRHHLFG
jgi:ABC-type Na+ efflux pump permease subunit